MILSSSVCLHKMWPWGHADSKWLLAAAPAFTKLCALVCFCWRGVHHFRETTAAFPSKQLSNKPPLLLPTHSHSLGSNLQPPNPIKSRSSGWILSRRSSNSVYGPSRGPIVSISICIGKLHTIKIEVLEEFHKALLRGASGHSEGGLHLSQGDPTKIAPLPSVHLSCMEIT